MKESTSEILQGTLDLMVLKTLEGLGPLHGYGIARRIERSGGAGYAQYPKQDHIEYKHACRAPRSFGGAMGSRCRSLGT